MCWKVAPTRGGVATTLNEIAKHANVGMILDERAIPLRESVKGACEVLLRYYEHVFPLRPGTEQLRLPELPIRVAFRHFPVRSSHPRAFAAACAAAIGP